MKTRHLLLASLALLLYAAVAYIMRPSTPGPAIAGSSVSAQPEGSLALVQLWHKLGHPVQTWQQVPGLLPNTKAVYIAVEPDDGAYTDTDVRALRDWVRRGHTVIWVSDVDCPLLHGLHMDSAPRHTAVEELTLRAPGGSTLDTWTHLHLTPTVTLTRRSIPAAAKVLQSQNGLILGLQAPLGTGSIVYFAVPEAFENRGVGTADNLQVPWALLPQQDLLWDEFGHGVVSQSAFAAMFGQGRQLSLLLLAAALVLYAWRGTVRFGTPRLGADEGPRLSSEFRYALAWHLQQPSLRDYQRTLLIRATERRLAQYLGIPANSGEMVIGQAVAVSADQELKTRYGRWRAQMQSGRNRKNRELQRATRYLLQWLNR